MSQRDYSPYQEKIIKRYYQNHDSIKSQRLAELVSELYLAEGKKCDRLWSQVKDALESLGIHPTRIEQIVTRKEPALLAEIVKELAAKGH